MKSFYSLYLRARALLMRSRVEGEMDEELRYHLELETDKNIRRGLPPVAARRQAMVAFGGLDTQREAMRDGRGIRWFEDIVADVRYALRWLMRSPGFATVAVLTLGLGIGATTAIFAVVNAVLLEPLPYAESDRLAIIYEQNRERGWLNSNISYPDYQSWKERVRSFEKLAIFQWNSHTFAGEGQAERVQGAAVSADLFPTLGVQPILGRGVTAEEEKRGDRVVIIGHGLWQRRFGSERSILGRTVTMNGQPYTVIGVMPPRFQFPYSGEAWLPLGPEDDFQQRNARYLAGAVGRLAEGVTRDEAEAELARVSQQMQKEYPDTNNGWEGQYQSIREDLFGTLSRAVMLLFVAAGLVLLIVCGNLANLLLARGAARQREVALRAAIGARRGRLIRQFLTESCVLAFLGGALGIAVAFWGVALLRTMAGDQLPAFITIRVEPQVYGFAFGIAAIVAAITGLLPALRGTRVQAQAALKEGGRSTAGVGGSRLRSALIVSEVALAVILLAGSMLLIKTMGALNDVQLGFDEENVLTARYSLASDKYEAEERRSLFLNEIQERMRAEPGVVDVGAAQGTPFSGWNVGTSYQVEGEAPPKEGEGLSTHVQVITPEYFRTMRIPIVKGRGIEATDAGGGVSAAVVNEAFVARHFKGQDPIGKRFKFGGGEGWSTIVGVVADFRHYQITEPMTAAAYFHYGANTPRQMTLAIRTRGNASDVIPALRRKLAELDPDIPAFRVETMEEVIARRTWVQRIARDILAAFAGTAALLAVIGLYGVISYSVARQRHEFGIRLALGAAPRRLWHGVVQQGLTLAMIGIAIGWVVAFWSARTLAQLLFEVQPGDFTTFLIVPVAVALLAAAASAVPALRAAATDPMLALRSE